MIVFLKKIKQLLLIIQDRLIRFKNAPMKFVGHFIYWINLTIVKLIYKKNNDNIPNLGSDYCKINQISINEDFIDEIVPVAGANGIQWSQKLAAHEGILTGISGGSTFAVAMEVANRAPKGSKILCMLADTAERYLSSLLFEDIEHLPKISSILY